MSMRLFVSVLLLAAASFSAAQDEGPLESLLEVFLVESSLNSDGEPVETLVAVEEAPPGETLEYVLSYANKGDSSLRGFVIKNPVPANTSYVADSASASIGAVFSVSIDNGVTYEEPPVMRTVVDASGEEREIEIPASQYTSVRWVVEEPLVPAAEMILRYRVLID